MRNAVPLGQPRYDHNAFVEPVRTVFHATGTERDLVGFFHGDAHGEITRAESLGGEFRLSSKPGAGTSVEILLP